LRTQAGFTVPALAPLVHEPLPGSETERLASEVAGIINRARSDRGETPVTTRQVLGFETSEVAPPADESESDEDEDLDEAEIQSDLIAVLASVDELASRSSRGARFGQPRPERAGCCVYARGAGLLRSDARGPGRSISGQRGT
jgi:hypothetical protein